MSVRQSALNIRPAGFEAPAVLAGAAAARPAAGHERAAEEALRRLEDLVVNDCRSIVAITGAGLSTDSGISDYRGPQGAYSKGSSVVLVWLVV